jgi:3-carboxy-cis,cis-muconate cycloisomerase
VLIEAQLAEVMATLADLARLHRDTPMAGRTHLQQALPITFGHKVAIWLSALQRSADRLEQAKPAPCRRSSVAPWARWPRSATADWMCAPPTRARSVSPSLTSPGTSPATGWSNGADAAVICGALGKIGYDVMILMATEIGEVFEPFSSHRGASSTMPQKRNPISSEILLANAKISRDAASLMLDAMVQDLERATGPWHAEWMALPQVCLLTAGSLAQAQFMLSGLIVDQAAMKRNLDSTRGLIVAEAVMMGLAPALGRQPAHDEVYAACRDAFTRSEPLLDALLRRPAIASALPRDQLAALCEPSNYLGTAGAMVDRVLARHMKR